MWTLCVLANELDFSSLVVARVEGSQSEVKNNEQVTTCTVNTFNLSFHYLQVKEVSSDLIFSHFPEITKMSLKSE